MYSHNDTHVLARSIVLQETTSIKRTKWRTRSPRLKARRDPKCSTGSTRRNNFAAPPRACLFQLPRMALPQTAFDHPSAHRLFAEMNIVSLAKCSLAKRRPEIVPLRVLAILRRAFLCLSPNLPLDRFVRSPCITIRSPCCFIRASSSAPIERLARSSRRPSAE